MGFNLETLIELEKTTVKYQGPKEVLEAINTYDNLTALKIEVSKVEKAKEDVEAKLKQLNVDYAHLQTVLDICDKLLYKYKFSLTAIESFNSKKPSN
jgi:predicted  nucleic acid-binding Zn-ribbon protein